jgi:hypothetical protein
MTMQDTIQLSRLTGNTSGWVAVKQEIVETSTTITIYQAKAPIGTSASDAKWLVKKTFIDRSIVGTTSITVTWATANGSAATNLSSLVYT